MKLFSKLFFIALLIGLLAACGSSDDAEESADNSSEEKKVIKMGTSADYPPFESYDEEGNFEGFDIEIAQLIADELGYELKIEDMNFDGLIGALQSGTVDMVMSAMNATEERKENVDFSIEYYHAGELFISEPDAGIESLDDLEGKVVGVQLGSIQAEGADKLSEEYGFEVKKIDKANLLVQELKTNKIDVAFLDESVAVQYMDEHGFVGFEDPTSSSPGFAVAFPKDSELVAEVDPVIQELIDSGKIEELEEKWLSEAE